MTENFLELIEKGGVWHCHGWVNGERIRRSTKTKNRLEAEEQRVKWLRDGEVGVSPGKAGQTLRDVIGAYRNRPRKRPYTYDTLKALDRIERGMGDVKLTALDARRVNAWADKEYDETNRFSRIKGLTLLRAACRYGARIGMLSSVPLIHTERIESKRLRFLERAELKVFLDECRRESEALWALCQFMAFTGGRRGEIIALRWDEIDFERRQVTFQSFKGRDGRTKKRTVPLNEPALEAARAMLKFRIVGAKDDVVFKGPSGKAWRRRKGTKQATHPIGWKRVVEKCGLVDFHPHDLRHTFASMLRREKRMELDRIAELLGHATLEMTQIYAHLIVEDFREDVDSLRL
jgi:integrase